MPATYWTKRRRKALELVLDDELTDRDIAAALGRSRTWLARQKRHPAFEDARKAAIEAFMEQLEAESAAERDVRWAAIPHRT